MITLITAVPGSGKTLLAVGLIIKFLEEGRPVYHNIAGLQVETFTNNQLLFDAPADWRDTPDGSVVIYDECQQEHLYPANAQRGKVEDGRLTAMETHRHTGHDLIFITQAPTFVHHHIRKLVGEHIHLYRGGGSKVVGKYTWSHTCDSPNDRREQERADFSTFRFNSDHFALYQSSTVHTHKFRIPKKILILLIFVTILVFFVGRGILTSSFMPWSLNDLPDPPLNIATTTPGIAPAPRVDDDNPITPPLFDLPVDRPLAGCMNSQRACMCWTSDLEPIYMTDKACRDLLTRPLPRIISTTSKRDNSNSSSPPDLFP